MGRRNTGRVKVELPVRLWGTDGEGKPFSQMVRTLDVSRRGALVGGFHGTLKPGDTVGIQYRNHNVRFRVVWIRPAGETGLSLGVTSLQPEKEIWGANLPAASKDDYVVPSAPALRRHEKRPNDRRKHMRFPVSGGATVSNPGGQEQHALRLSDISLEGCFIETKSPLPVNTRLKVLARIQELEIEAFGMVRASFPNTAMGVQFTLMSPPDVVRLKAIISRLEAEDRLGASKAEDIWRG